MLYKFSESASGPAKFVSRDEISSVDIMFKSAQLKGGNKQRMSRLSGNLEVIAEILRENIGLSKEDFYLGGESYSLRTNRIARGMGFER